MYDDTIPLELTKEDWLQNKKRLCERCEHSYNFHNIGGKACWKAYCMCSSFKGETLVSKIKARGTFWMIVGEPGAGTEHNPRHVYTSEIAARNAAARLARENNKRFYLLESKDWVEPTAPPIRWGSGDLAPEA